MKKQTFLIAFLILLFGPVQSQMICDNTVLDFDGIDDYIQSTSPLSGSVDMTIELWFRTESTSTGVCDNTSLANFRWLIGWDDSNFGIGDCNGDLDIVYSPLCPIGTGLCSSLSGFPINDGAWHHVAVIKGGGGIRILVDGMYYTNFAEGVYDLSGSFRIGSSGTGNIGQNWDGQIDEVRIWSDIRTDEEIALSYECGVDPLSDNLVLYYNFEEGLGDQNNTGITEVEDQTPSNIDGTLHNFALFDTTSNYTCADYGWTEDCAINTDCATEISECCTAPVDVLYILDNSGSVEPLEFDVMVDLVNQSMEQVDSSYCDAQFAVVHYSGTCGDEIYIEYDFINAASIPSITRPSALIPSGDDLNKALGSILTALSGTVGPQAIPSAPFTTLSPRSGANLLVVIFTDALGGIQAVDECISGGSAMAPFDNANLLKANPYNANITLVHFIPGLPLAESTGAAIASPGGNHTGVVANNPGDPDNGILPRQFIPVSFAASSLDLVASLPQCDSLPPFMCCEDLLVQHSFLPESNGCCVSVSIDNGTNANITGFEVELLSSEYQFNTGALVVGAGYNWDDVPSGTLLNVTSTNPGGVLPTGLSPDILKYCLTPTVSNPTTTPNLIYRWYQHLPDGTRRILCTELFESDCYLPEPDPCMSLDNLTVSCNPENPYEYLINFTVTNNSDFPAEKIILEQLPPGFAFSACGTTSQTNIIAVPFDSGPLLPDSTSSVLCVKIVSPSAIFSAQDICLDIGLFGAFDCCHSVESVCLTLENCCDPCEERAIVVDEIVSDSASCCYSLDIIDSCGYAFFTKIETEVLTPGVIFGYHALGGPDSEDWFVLADSDEKRITWWSQNTFLPYGITEDIIQFCLSGVDNSAQVPQEVVVRWYSLNGEGEESVACTDTLEFSCEPPVDYSCLDVSGRSIECIADSNKYQYIFEVTNTSAIPFSADFLDVSIIDTTGLYFDPSGGVFALPQPFNPGDSYQITSCIKTTDSFPSLASELILRYRLLFAEGDTCCYNAVLDTLTLPECGPADCADLSLELHSANDSTCCYSLDYDNTYTAPVKMFELEVLTPSYILDQPTVGGNDSLDWYNPLRDSTTVQWALINGDALPRAQQSALINFCLSSPAFDSTAEVVIRWFDLDSVVVCTDTLLFDCLAEELSPCLDSLAFYDLVDMGFDTLIDCRTLQVSSIGLEDTYSFSWDWGDGMVTDTFVGGTEAIFYEYEQVGDFEVCMQVEGMDDNGNICWQRSVCQMVTIESCCDIDNVVVRNGLTPNGDGINDNFSILGIDQCQGINLKVYNRWGNIVYEQDKYEDSPDWDGKSTSNIALPQGTYFYILEFEDIDERKAGYLDIRY